MFFRYSRVRFFEISWRDCEDLWKQSSQEKETININQLSYYLNVKDPCIIPLIFIFLSCRKKVYDYKELSPENLKFCCESLITTH